MNAPYDEDSAVFFLEQLISLTLQNRLAKWKFLMHNVFKLKGNMQVLTLEATLPVSQPNMDP